MKETEMVTGSSCPHCTGPVVADVVLENMAPKGEKPTTKMTATYRCANENCAIVFAHPPGQINWLTNIGANIVEAFK